MKYFKKIVGEKIYLSPRNIEDVERYTEWLNDFETTDYTGRSHQSMSLENEKKYLEEHSNEDTVFGIIELKTDKLVGVVGLHQVNHFKRTATLGIFIGDKELRNKGYGTEAVELIVDYGFNYLNLNNIKLDVMEFNDRAIACYKKCGFKEIGKRRKCEFINGKYYDSIAMDILAEEFSKKVIKNRNI